MLTFYECRHNDIMVIAVYSGVGKVNAAIATQTMIDCFHVNCIISVGTCGSLAGKMKIFDTLIADSCLYHDLEATILTAFHPWMETAIFRCSPALVAMAADCTVEYPVHFGLLATGDYFLDSEEQRKKLLAEYPDVLGVDMESSAIAHVCYVNCVPFLAVRTVTDDGQNNAEEVFFSNVDKAAERSCHVCLKLFCLMET